MRWSAPMVLVALVFAVAAFLLGATGPVGMMLWPASSDVPAPAATQLPFFIFYSAIAATGFGVAVAFLIHGWSWVQRVAGASRARAVRMYVAIAWVLGNWAIHDNLHIINGNNMQGLLYIEFAFHGTLILAGWVLAASFLTALREKAADGQRASA